MTRYPGVEKALANLKNWSLRPEWADHCEEIFALHLDLACNEFDVDTEDLVDTLGPAHNLLFDFVFEDFLCARFGDDGELNITEEYLKRRGWREKRPARRYLEALVVSAPSLYEVLDTKPGHSLVVSDMIGDPTPQTINDKLASRNFCRWDRFAARVLRINEKPYFSGPLLQFDFEHADALFDDYLEESAEMFSLVDEISEFEAGDADTVESLLQTTMTFESGPIFTNNWLFQELHRLLPVPEIDADLKKKLEENLFIRINFPIIGSISEIADRLDDTNGLERNSVDAFGWTWFDPDAPLHDNQNQKNLTYLAADDREYSPLGEIKVNAKFVILVLLSLEHEDEGLDFLRDTLTDLVGEAEVVTMSISQMREWNICRRQPETPEPGSDLGDTAWQAFLDRYYKQSLDQPLPILEDLTPNEVAGSEIQRDDLTHWLKYQENATAKRALEMGKPAYDFRWLWRELGLNYPA